MAQDKKMNMHKLLLLIFFLFPVFKLSIAQDAKVLSNIDHYLSDQFKELGLTKTDISAYRAINYHQSDHSGVHHIYVQQYHDGIPVEGAIMSINLNNTGKIIFTGNNFIQDLSAKTIDQSIVIRPESSIYSFTDHLGIVRDYPLWVEKNTGDKEFVFKSPTLVSADIPVKLVYKQIDSEEIRLSWQLELDLKQSHDHWMAWVDVQSGEILAQN